MRSLNLTLFTIFLLPIESQIRDGKPESLDQPQTDTQVTVVGATLPKRVESILNRMIPV